MITGTGSFFEGPQGAQRLEPLAQRLQVDFSTDAKFDNPRAVQIRLPSFDLERLCEVGRKVRDIFDLDDRLLIVTTDRISAYDAILPNPIPGKGIVLTQMTLGWYELFSGSIRTHFMTANPEERSR